MTPIEPRVDDEAWSDAVLVWNGLVASVPALVVRPASAEELSAAVAFARDHALSLRVQGVDSDAGATAGERCLTLDLSYLQVARNAPQR